MYKNESISFLNPKRLLIQKQIIYLQFHYPSFQSLLDIFKVAKARILQIFVSVLQEEG